MSSNVKRSIRRIFNEKLNEIEQLDSVEDHGDLNEALVGLQFEDGHTHVHYPSDEAALELISAMNKQKGIRPGGKSVISLPPVRIKDGKVRKIVFAHHRALGDEVMFSAGIRDFKLLFPEIIINAEGSHPAIWEHNPYIDKTLDKNDPDVEYYRVGYKSMAKNTYIHYAHMFLLDMIASADLTSPLHLPLGEYCAALSNGEVGDPCLGNPKKTSEAREPFISLRDKYSGFTRKFGKQRGDLFLTDEEKEYNLVKEVYGVDKFWVVAPGGKRDYTAKIWDWRKFQKVIDHFDGLLKFVVIGKSDLLIEKLDNVINLTDNYNKDLRGLFSLVYHSDGCVSGPSALMHIAAATEPKINKERKPCVSIFGGRESVMWSWYYNHQVLHTNGVFTCCSDGGCWKARTYPIAKSPKHNSSLCQNTVTVDGRTIQACMESITEQDMIRSIEKYYDGNIYTFNTGNKIPEKKESIKLKESTSAKEINLLGNLNTDGGGEQSLIKISEILKEAGWKINLHPWDSVHKRFKDLDISKYSFKNGMEKHMVKNIPLLFYANDCVWDFPKTAHQIVANSSSMILGINYMIGNFKKPQHSSWLSRSGKLKAVVFQNEEKREEWDSQVVGFEDTKKIVLFGAIDLQTFYEVCTAERKGKDFVVLKHCKPDHRKYVTEESKNKGDKIHIWQKHFYKDVDTKFYERLLKNVKNIRFEFMEAHPELVEYFKDEDRMTFHKWNAMPVQEFLSRGHAYLYRTSNDWRDNYPRVVAEALASGLPILSEPRDGTKDRIVHGNTGFYACHYDEFELHLKTLERKEKLRAAMGQNAKDWAKANLDPKKWIEIIEGII